MRDAQPHWIAPRLDRAIIDVATLNRIPRLKRSHEMSDEGKQAFFKVVEGQGIEQRRVCIGFVIHQITHILCVDGFKARLFMRFCHAILNKTSAGPCAHGVLQTIA